ncbi:PIR protein [Plasmodium ovale]|uniref:PIR protein n=1 Tax=Plasmodium ovale TaxID=36330 RepID=A0A1D3JEE0_PLAOA|nr:PIR protein [Plasmodium ovale]
MSGTKVDTTLKSLRENYTFQKNPYIQKFYNELESTCDNNISYSCKKEISNKEEINENVKKFYHKISENQSKLLRIGDNFSVFKGERSKRCMYFKYWFYDQVITNGFDNNQIKQIFKLFEDLDNNIKFYITHQSDNNDFTGSPNSPWFTCKICYSNLDHIKKLKLSLDYIENYDRTKNTSTISEVICNSEYKGYINEIIELYKSKSGDSYQQSKYLCDELDEFKKIHNINELFKMQCNAEHESLYGGLQQARPSSPTANPSLNKTISASLSIVSIFGIVSFLYKVNEENTTELPENLLDYVDTNSQRDNHNIGYNSV